jgi:hypothetical protein
MLEDYGVIEDDRVARALGAAENSFFIVFRHLDHNLKDICSDP